MSIYGGIRYKAVDYDAPVQLNSGVSLPEAVKIWIESLRRAVRQARECSAWDWHFRVCAWKRKEGV
jgi:hypothetical protein